MATIVLGLGLLAVPSPPAGAVQVFQDHIVSANPSDITPNIIDAPHENHQVLSIAQIGTRTYAAGEFTQIQNAGGGPIYTVNGIFAFFTATGQIDVNGFGFPHLARRIEVIAPSQDGSALFLGGGFTHIDGVPEAGVASLNPATGAVNTQFKVNANGRVYDMVARGGSLYIGGMFTTVNGLPHSGVAAVDPATGAVSSELSLQFTGTRLDRKAMRVDNLDVTPDASRLIVTGNYTAVNGVPRGQVTMIDLTTSPDSLANWDTQRFTPLCATKFSTYIRDVDFSPDGSYLVIATTGATAINHGGTPTSGPICDGSARFETYATGSNLQPTWVNYVGGDTNYSVAITGTVVYLAGHERWQNNYFGADVGQPGSVRRRGIAAVSPVNGVPFAWNPGRVRGLGAQALLATSDGLFVGSDTDQIGGEYHAKLALMPLTGGEFVPPANPGTIPGELYTIQQDGTMVARTFDGTTFGAAVTRTALNWSDVRGAFMLSGTLYTGHSDGSLRKQTLNGDKVGTQKTLNLHGLETETQQPPDMTTQLSGASGMFFDPSNGRLYYTVTGDHNLYYRAFEPESGILGDFRYTACTWDPSPSVNTCGGLDPAIVHGMTLAGGHIYFGRGDGNLSTVPFTSGTTVVGFGTVGTPATVISGPGIDGRNWDSRALFFRSDGS